MNNNHLSDLLWDKIRDVACSTKRNANCIVLLNKADLAKAVKNITQEELDLVFLNCNNTVKFLAN